MKSSSSIFGALSYALALVLCLSLVSCKGEGPDVRVSSVNLDYDALELCVGETAMLKATVSPSDATNQNVIWSSGNPEIASVADGVVCALAEGNTAIVAVTEDGGKKATCSLTVKPEPRNEVDEELSAAKAYDLSSTGTANCYVVTNPGTYKFRAVKGNGKSPLKDMARCAVLWESFGTAVAPSPKSLIRQVGYEGGYILFKTTDVFKKGNALIAAIDANGTVLWSWHIWITDAPQGQVYFNEAGVVMDRNLGALSEKPGEASALGLMYQWGRKDPFLGSSSISVPVSAEASIAFPPVVKSDETTGTIEYAIAHPTTYITSGRDWDWCWHPEGTEALWPKSESPKSLYDPCPAGWRVPDGGYEGFWVKVTSGNKRFTVPTDESVRAANLSGLFGDDAAIWYPNTGVIDCSTAELYGVGLCGIVWSAGSSDYLANCIVIEVDAKIYLVSSTGRAFGCPVRCVQE